MTDCFCCTFKMYIYHISLLPDPALLQELPSSRTVTATAPPSLPPSSPTQPRLSPPHPRAGDTSHPQTPRGRPLPSSGQGPPALPPQPQKRLGHSKTLHFAFLTRTGAVLLPRALSTELPCRVVPRTSAVTPGTQGCQPTSRVPAGAPGPAHRQPGSCSTHIPSSTARDFSKRVGPSVQTAGPNLRIL